MLEEYSMEELAYEYLDRVERAKADENRVEQESDKIEEAKEQENLAWAEEMERLEAQEMASNPAKDDESWMEEQLAKNKAEFGEDFGEDLNLNFEE